jgi:EamA-like transporter family
MTAQIIALTAAIVYAMSFILSKRGMLYSTPIAITFVSLPIQTMVLFAIVFLFIVAGPLESLGLLLVLYAQSFGPVVVVTPLSATLPLWVAIGSKLFLRDVEEISSRTVIGATLVPCGTVAISLANP